MKNYYEILEVNRKASKEVIEKAYRVLVKKYHPDQYAGEKQVYAEKKIKDINEAYRVLSDDFLKEQYDTELENEMEIVYSNRYKQRNVENINTNLNSNSNIQNEENIEEDMREKRKREKAEYRKKMSSFSGMIELTKELYANRPKREELKNMTKKDLYAIGLTIIVIIVIGIILWCIPFTNSWMRELIFENELFKWIGGLFGKK